MFPVQHSAPQPLRVAGPMQTIPWASKQVFGSMAVVMRAPELGEGEVGRFGVLLGAFFAQRDVRGQHRSLRWKGAGQQCLDRRLEQFGCRRAAGQVVVHVDHLVQRPDHPAELGKPDRSAVAAEREGRTGVFGVHRRRCLVVHVAEDLLPVELVGKSGDAAGVRAGAVGDHHEALAAEHPGHLLLFGGSDGAVDQGGSDGAVRHGLDVLAFEVHCDGPQDDVHGGGHFQQPFGEVHDGFLAPAAGGAPVEGDFRLVRHGGPPRWC